jgi:hypothetical protein
MSVGRVIEGRDMNSTNARSTFTNESGVIATTSRGMLWLAWNTIRLPVLAVLTVLEPFVCTALTLLAVFGIFFALFFEFLIRLSHFPFWMMMGFAVGCALLQMLYYLLIRLFSFR